MIDAIQVITERKLTVLTCFLQMTMANCILESWRETLLGPQFTNERESEADVDNRLHIQWVE